jgi:hypothetical protein
MTSAQRALPDALACWNAGDLDGYLGLYDDGIRLYGTERFSQADMLGLLVQIGAVAAPA